MQFNLQWTGYGDAENQWLPADQAHCPILIAQYLNQRIDSAENNMQLMLDIFRNNGILVPNLVFPPPPPRYESPAPPNQAMNNIAPIDNPLPQYRSRYGTFPPSYEEVVGNDTMLVLPPSPPILPIDDEEIPQASNIGMMPEPADS